MQFAIGVGWTIGAVLAGGVIGLAIFLAAGTLWVMVVIALILAVLFYFVAYGIGTTAVFPGLQAIIAPGDPSFTTAGGAAAAAQITLPDAQNEYFARGAMIGFTAVTNAAVVFWLALAANPIYTMITAVFVFVVNSAVAILALARNRGFQALLGWSSWIFPLSYIATAVGFVLFVGNWFWTRVTGFNPYEVTLDWTTGAVESYGGRIDPIANQFTLAFSLGNFNYITTNVAVPAQFTVASVSSHETGHTLNTAAFGGVVLWINAADQNWIPNMNDARGNLAYGELLAESHVVAMPGTQGTANFGFSVRAWH